MCLIFICLCRPLFNIYFFASCPFLLCGLPRACHVYRAAIFTISSFASISSTTGFAFSFFTTSFFFCFDDSDANDAIASPRSKCAQYKYSKANTKGGLGDTNDFFFGTIFNFTLAPPPPRCFFKLIITQNTHYFCFISTKHYPF
eukprot:623029_1